MCYIGREGMLYEYVVMEYIYLDLELSSQMLKEHHYGRMERMIEQGSVIFFM